MLELVFAPAEKWIARSDQDIIDGGLSHYCLPSPAVFVMIMYVVYCIAQTETVPCYWPQSHAVLQHGIDFCCQSMLRLAQILVRSCQFIFDQAATVHFCMCTALYVVRHTSCLKAKSVVAERSPISVHHSAIGCD